jgi:hypothetical protein
MSQTAGRAAVLLPGTAYRPVAPLLMFAGVAARSRGAELHPLDWTAPANLGDRAAGWVREQVTPVLDELAAGGIPAPLLVGKSLGTHAAALAAERDLPAIWLTPLLRHAPLVQALRGCTAPFLLVGGTADQLWDGEAARALSPHVCEVDGADHGMFVPGPLAGSAAVLGTVATAVERFLDRVIWPV